MNEILVEYSSKKHQAIVSGILTGASVDDLVLRHKITKNTILRIRRHVKEFKIFNLVLTDGLTKIPVAAVRTRKGFIHARRHIICKYRGTFHNLQLPQWVLTDGNETVKISDLRSAEKKDSLE